MLRRDRDLVINSETVNENDEDVEKADKTEEG